MFLLLAFLEMVSRPKNTIDKPVSNLKEAVKLHIEEKG